MSVAYHKPLENHYAIAILAEIITYTTEVTQYPKKPLSSLLVMPKGKCTMEQFHHRFFQLKSKSFNLKTVTGCFEFSETGVPHFHGIAVVDRRKKSFSELKLTCIRKDLCNPNSYIKYSKYCVNQGPSLMVIRGKLFRYSQKRNKMVPLERTKANIVELINGKKGYKFS